MAYKLDGTLYGIAYGWMPGVEGIKVNTNICALFWMTAFAVFIAWPFIFSARSFGWAVRIIGAPFALLLFGYWPAGSDWRLDIDNSGSRLPFKPISKWPNFGGCHVMPVVVIAVLTVVVLVVVVVYKLIFQLFFVDIVFASGTYTAVFLGVVAFMISACVVWIRRTTISDNEMWHMCSAYVKSRKEKYCMSVTFE